MGVREADLCGSDFDPGPFSPLMGIQGMVTRTGSKQEVWRGNQRITVDEAVRVNTIDGAHATREEAIKGSTTPGKLADFVILTDDRAHGRSLQDQGCQSRPHRGGWGNGVSGMMEQ